MRLPKDILSDTYRKPNVILCQTNKEKIGKLNETDLNGTFKWNSYSEISFEVGRTYYDMVTGEIKVNPYYDKIEGLRLVYLEGFGYFQLQDPEIEGDGIKEIKSINAYSLEYDLSQRYLTSFIINKGTTGSIDGVHIYDNTNPSKSLLHLIIGEKAIDWSIGHVDTSIASKRFSFEEDRISVYDFLMNTLCGTAKCVVMFDTINNTINIYDEETAGSETDVYITFENLAQNINIEYSADDIKTVLTVGGADDLSIREVNLGLSNITDLSYYHSVEWMGQDLYDAYSNYLNIIETNKSAYEQAYSNAQVYVRQISEIKNRTSEDLTSAKLTSFNEFLIDFYKNHYVVNTTKLNELTTSFSFVDRTKWTTFKNTMTSTASNENKDAAILTILDEIWNEYGLSLLSIQLDAYKGTQQAQTQQGMSNIEDDKYYLYYATYMLLTSVQNKINYVNGIISEKQTLLDQANAQVLEISNRVSLSNNLTIAQRIRLAPFLREDEYKDDNFVVIETDTEDDILEIKNELLDTAKKELAKLSQPQLSFKMDMGNIYALPEFAPMHNQFQLGNFIKVGIRSDYIKKSRLMQVDMNFDDFSDFSVIFGDILSLQDQSDIHADLLSQAINAGKQVANNSSYWQRASVTASEIEERINQGLLDEATAIKAIDGNQSAEIDKYGIHLRKKNELGEYEAKQGWITDNKILYTSDNWQTTNSVFGEFQYDADGDGVKETHWGVISKSVVSGFIQGSDIEGGTINIGDGTFYVDENGNISMFGGHLDGDVIVGNQTVNELADKVNEAYENGNMVSDTNEELSSQISRIDEIESKQDELMHRVNWNANGALIFRGGTVTNGTWVPSGFSSQFNSEELAFYSGQTKVAWISGRTSGSTEDPQFYVQDASIEGDLNVGGNAVVNNNFYINNTYANNTLTFKAEANGSFSLMVTT